MYFTDGKFVFFFFLGSITVCESSPSRNHWRHWDFFGFSTNEKISIWPVKFDSIIDQVHFSAVLNCHNTICNISCPFSIKNSPWPRVGLRYLKNHWSYWDFLSSSTNEHFTNAPWKLKLKKHIINESLPMTYFIQNRFYYNRYRIYRICNITIAKRFNKKIKSIWIMHSWSFLFLISFLNIMFE